MNTDWGGGEDVSAAGDKRDVTLPEPDPPSPVGLVVKSQMRV